jgi:rhodanese-related sulfurtransferase
VAEATANVRVYDVPAAVERHRTGGAVFVDVRDAPELWRDGRIPGSINASRGMLEFHADPASSVFLEELGSGRELVCYCAVGARSALAADRLREMGIDDVATVAGGFRAWIAAGGPVEDATPSM